MASDSLKAAAKLPEKVKAPAPIPVKLATPPPPPAPLKVTAKVFADELSNGKGSALKTQSAKVIPSFEAPPVQASLPTFKAGAYGLVATGVSSSEGVPPRREEDQTRAAIDDWRKISQGRGKPVDDQTFVSALEEHAHEPAYVAKFIQAADSDGALFPTVTHAWQNPANREVITASVGAAMNGTPPLLNPQKVAAFVQLEAEANKTAAVPSTAWADLAAGIGAPSTTSPERVTATQKVEAAQAELADGQNKAKEADEKLKQQMSTLGYVLTPEQQQQYIENYQSEPGNAAVYKRVAEASAKLEGVLSDPAVRAAAIDDPDVAAKVLQGYQQLADTPQAKKALEFAGLINDPSSIEGKAFRAGAGLPEAAFTKMVGEKLVEPATTRYFSEELLAQGGNAEAALASFKGLVENGKGLKSLFSVGGDFTKAMKDLEASSKGTFSTLEKVTSDFASKGPIGRALAGIGLISGAFSAKSAIEEGKYLEAMKSIASTSESGLKLVVGVTAAIAKTGQIAARYGTGVEVGVATASKFAAKLMPALGFLTNSISAAVHLKGAVDDKSIGLALAAAGDCVAAMGSVFPGAGVPLSVIGASISTLGELIDKGMKDGANKKERAAGLEKLGFSKEIAQQLADADGETLHALKNGLGFSTQQVIETVMQRPALTNGDYLSGWKNLATMAKGANVSPAEMQKFLNEQLGSDEEIIDLMRITPLKNASQEEVLIALRLEPEGNRAAKKFLQYLTYRGIES
jgi:hypothetical protein